MPRATIIHNPTAGDGRPTGSELRELIERQGYTPAYATTDTDLDAALQDPGDLVVVAGGDGTVGQVAARILGRDVPLAILPVGTANNLAASIGLGGSVDLAVAGLRAAGATQLRLGSVRGPWGVRPFAESAGLGLFAHAMPVLSALKRSDHGTMPREAQIRQDRQALRRLVDPFVARSVHLWLDGRPEHGDYLLVEVMNAPMLGPGLRLAPRANPGDDRLEVVLVRDADRDRFGRWLDDDPGADPGFDVRSVRRVDLRWDGDPLHIDGDSWADESAPFNNVRTVPQEGPTAVRIELQPGRVTVLVPAGPRPEPAAPGGGDVARPRED